MGKIISRSVPRRKMETSPVTAVGVWIYSVKTNRYLYLMRNDPKHYGLWGLPGGKIEKGETIIGAIKRECQEELGLVPEAIRLIPLEKFTTDDQKFTYHTFFCSVPSEFCPILNDEHIGWAWVQSGKWPKPVHSGLWATINFDIVQDKIKYLENASSKKFSSS
jgi:8-oxo-dGTP pyrophosphatase MutT (NUDIX family)